MQKTTQELLMQSESIPDFLQKEYLRRLERNSNYSLRAFARDLDLSPSRLSEGLNLKKGFSIKTVEKISQQLRLPKKTQDFLRDLCLSQGHKNKGVRSNAGDRVKSSRKNSEIIKMDAEKFKVISDWYHNAILEMTVLSNFQSEAPWIAQKLSISVPQAEEAIKRLMNLGLLKEKSGKLIANPEILSTSPKVSIPAYRKFHRQMFEKAYRSLQEDPIERRHIQSMIVALPQARMADFLEQIQVFMKQFWEQNEKLGKDQLYSLNIQLIPLTKDESKKI